MSKQVVYVHSLTLFSQRSVGPHKHCSAWELNLYASEVLITFPVAHAIDPAGQCLER